MARKIVPMTLAVKLRRKRKRRRGGAKVQTHLAPISLIIYCKTFAVALSQTIQHL
jgi:hypothetical protein